jgi:hypothetical protein
MYKARNRTYGSSYKQQAKEKSFVSRHRRSSVRAKPGHGPPMFSTKKLFTPMYRRVSPSEAVAYPLHCLSPSILSQFRSLDKASRPGGINGASASSIEEQCHAPARSHELPRERCMCGCGHRQKIHEPASDAEVESTANLLQFPCSCIFFLSLKSRLI